MKSQTKRFFQAPTADIIAIETEDIITASPGEGGSIITPGENEGPFVPA